MAKPVNDVLVNQTYRLSPEDVELLREVANLTKSYPAEIVRWAIRTYCLSANTGLIRPVDQRRLRKAYGHLPIGHATFNVIHFQAEAEERDIIGGEALADVVE